MKKINRNNHLKTEDWFWREFTVNMSADAQMDLEEIFLNTSAWYLFTCDSLNSPSARSHVKHHTTDASEMFQVKIHFHPKIKSLSDWKLENWHQRDTLAVLGMFQESDCVVNEPSSTFQKIKLNFILAQGRTFVLNWPPIKRRLNWKPTALHWALERYERVYWK